MLSGFLLMCCSSAHIELRLSTYGAKAPHIWSWGLAHMELGLSTYGVDGRHLSFQRLNTLQYVVDMKATYSQKKAEPSMMNRIYLVIRRLFLRE